MAFSFPNFGNRDWNILSNVASFSKANSQSLQKQKGYYIFPGNFMICWGNVLDNSGDGSIGRVNFPKAFSEPYGGLCTRSQITDHPSIVYGGSAITHLETTYAIFDSTLDDTNKDPFFWVVWGLAGDDAYA